MPAEGVNFSGDWHTGKIDADGEEIPPAHKNARYTVAPERRWPTATRAGRPGGRAASAASSTAGATATRCVPVQQSLRLGRTASSPWARRWRRETTAATIGAEGVRKFNLMSILDFVAIPLGKYIQNNLDFAARPTKPPADLRRQLLPQGRRRQVPQRHAGQGTSGSSGWNCASTARPAPSAPPPAAPARTRTSRTSSSRCSRRTTPRRTTSQQFTIRIPQNLAKLDRIEQVYRSQVADTPAAVFEVLRAQRQRLEDARPSTGT